VVDHCCMQRKNAFEHDAEAHLCAP
jgi:hypothetical protein